MVDLNLDQSCSRYLKVEVVNHPIFKILAEVDHAQFVHYVELAYNANHLQIKNDTGTIKI